ncbi:MAG: hypothetical protein D6743_18395 [Calditrichaeota bacterium]|nr:MAG: hypothetical protein D6743_18395 [Calditrichota bacterium]
MAWQIVRLDLASRRTELVVRSVGRPLSEGYRRLGVGSLPDFASGLLLSESPEGKHRVTFRRRTQDGLVYFDLTTPDDTGSQQSIFETESWNTYSHIAWVPTVLWLDEESFLTLGFVSDFDPTFPQSRGEFSIVKVDLATREMTILYHDRNLNPFPRFVLDAKEPALLFQRTTPDRDQTELCRLNLNDNRVDLIYRVPGELGQVRFSRTGDSVVLSQRLGENFDIIRLVLDRGADLRFAGR